jgi:hypothetical protein
VSATAFRAAVEARDFDAAIDLLAEDVVFRSPAVFKSYEGREAVSVLLRAVAETFEDFEYTDAFEGEDVHGLWFHARVGDRRLDGVDLLRFASEGRIREFTVMVRPLSGLIALAEAMGERLTRAGT